MNGAFPKKHHVRLELGAQLPQCLENQCSVHSELMIRNLGLASKYVKRILWRMVRSENSEGFKPHNPCAFAKRVISVKPFLQSPLTIRSYSIASTFDHPMQWHGALLGIARTKYMFTTFSNPCWFLSRARKHFGGLPFQLWSSLVVQPIVESSIRSFRGIIRNCALVLA